MLYLQATRKAIARLGLDREELPGPGTTDSVLGNWFLNVVPMGGREAYLFMSTRSLLSFPMLIGTLEPGPCDMLLFLEHGITMLMKSMGIPRSQSSLLLQDLSELALCRNHDKALIGVYSAIANEYFQRLGHPGNLPKTDIASVIAATNSAPRATLDWGNSFEVSRELLAASVA